MHNPFTSSAHQADPLELSAIEALLLGGEHQMSNASDTEDPFAAAASARHLFDHEFEPFGVQSRSGSPASRRRELASAPPQPARKRSPRL